MAERLALALNTCAFLLLEAGLLRVLGVGQWYHLAFLAISTALLGGGLGAMLTARAARAREGAERGALVCLLALPLLSVPCFWLYNLLPLEPQRLLGEPLQWILFPAACLLLAVPFLLSGAATALLFSRAPERAPRLYFFDLAGAALGAPLALASVSVLGAYGPAVGAALLWALAATLLAGRRRAALGVAGLGLLGGLLCVWRGDRLPLHITRGKTIGGLPAEAVLRDRRTVAWSGWGPLGRLDVLRAQGGYQVLIDGGAALSRMPGPQGDEAEDLRLVLAALRPRSVLVIGAGGGLEVRLALLGGAERVVAVELNPLMGRLLRREFDEALGGLFRDPRVTLVIDEGRHYLAQGTARFDAILSIHSISNAAAGGLALAESYALTQEALRDYLAHLSPRGFLLISRPQGQLARLVRTAEAAWARPDLARHALLYTDETGRAPEERFYGALLLALEPAPLPGLAERLGARRYPAWPLAAPPAPAGGARALLRPATDDRPFFNQRVPMHALRPVDLRALGSAAARGGERLALEELPVAELTLVLLLVQLGALGALLLFLPLRRAPAAAPGDRPGLWATYFALLGAAFLFVEVGLLQQLGRGLGHPAYAQALVLFCLLASSGLGSLLDRRPERGQPALWVAALVALLALGLPGAIDGLLRLPLGLRAAGALLLVAPAALLMGRPFPRGLAARRGPQVAWALAVNSYASVLASVLALLLAMALGLRAVLLLGAALYAAAGLLHRRLSAPGV